MTSNFYVSGAAAMTSNRDDWETPQALFDALDAVYHFDLDPASTDANAKCERHYTVEQDGLKQPWGGFSVFLNPPYGRGMAAWMKKACESAREPNTCVVALIPARTDTAWFHDYVYHIADVTFLRGRVKYELGGEPVGASAPFPSMICVWDNRE